MVLNSLRLALSCSHVCDLSSFCGQSHSPCAPLCCTCRMPLPHGTQPKAFPRVALDLATTVERIQQNFCICDPTLPDCPIVYASDAFLDLTEYKREEVLGRNWWVGPRLSVFVCASALGAGIKSTMHSTAKGAALGSALCLSQTPAPMPAPAALSLPLLPCSRFLQGTGTDPNTVTLIREAVRDNQEITVRCVGYIDHAPGFMCMICAAICASKAAFWCCCCQ